MSIENLELTALQDAVRRLSLVFEDDSVTIGNQTTGTFVAVPEVGGVVLRVLADGGTIDDAATAARESAGEEVDIADFLDVLQDAGILEFVGEQEPNGPKPRWIGGISQRAARPFFGPFAWSLYVVAAAFCVVATVMKPELRPTYESFMYLPDPMLSLITLYGLDLALTAAHEAWHWLAGRAAGVPARFRLSYRGAVLVAETDLSLLLTLPRRQRYGPLLAGLALNAVVLAVALATRWLYFASVLPVPDVIARLLAAVVLSSVLVIVMQCAVFLRTDLYAVLACALRCENLYRVSWLTLKHRLWPLTDQQTQEIQAASPRDRAVARWFSLLYLLGMLGVAWLMLHFAIPAGVGIIYWMFRNVISLSMSTAAFWESLTVATLICVEMLLPIPLAIRERRLRRAGVLS